MDAKVQEIFDIIDKDKSNSIDLSEFKAYCNQIHGLVLAGQTPEEVFAMIDINSDGSIDPSELKEYVSKHSAQFQ